ncbi:peptide ABC transporter substrate-binding protein [Parendozoicomonas haliclonae]|uniref:peptide ABC transporter substrate-binding protein n=1 Tax=Parendozoicomonas haliclonae TaxID=1960125 RepID=UPI0013FDA244|nr:peptide ABC transporter substrate-binding protein [Parendozoicomonas haliclonae]
MPFLIFTSLAWSKDQVIHMGQLSDPHTLNPFQVQTSDSAFISNNIFESLVVVDADGNIIPGQAESWRLENNGQRLVFTLRKGLKWSDGTPLVAEDFVAGLRYMADPSNAFMMASKLKMMRLVNADAVLKGEKPPSALGVSAPDAQTVVMELESPVNFALSLLSTTAFPLPRQVVSKFSETWSRPEHIVVNGAYLPEKWVINEKLELVRNDHYWAADQVGIYRAVLYPLAPDTELKHYEAGQLDMTRSVVSNRSQWLKKKFAGELRIQPMPGTYFYLFNLDNPDLKESSLRQSLAFAIDRTLITDRLLGLGQQPSRWFAPAESVNQPGVESPLDAGRKALLKEGRAAGQLPDKLEILYNTMDSHRQIALAVADMWKRNIGLNVGLRNMEWNALSDELNKKQFAIARMGWAMGDPDPCFLYIMFTSGSPMNQTGYKSAEYDRAFNHACYQTNPQLRQQSILKLEELLARDMPAIPLYNYTDVRLVKPYVKGFPESGQYPYFRIQDLWLEK